MVKKGGRGTGDDNKSDDYQRLQHLLVWEHICCVCIDGHENHRTEQG